MTPFGGWDMPLQYASGTLTEHMACRESAVVFDVSHLGTVRVEGADAKSRLQAAFTNDLDKITPGRAQYTHLLDAGDASVLDDIIVWWIDDEVFDVMPNASNTDRVIAAIGGRDTTTTRAVLAVQGPSARALVETVIPDVAGLRKFGVRRVTWNGFECVVAGTGYTGESGVEIAIPAAGARDLWSAITATGVVPAGLGARDTLRLEAALPLHGHELGSGITTLHADLEWVVAWEKPFIGREALRSVKECGLDRILRGIATEGRRPPRAECEVLAGGRSVGVVTSGNFSPILGHGIALALLHTDVVGDVIIDVRGSELPGRVVPTPFVAKK